MKKNLSFSVIIPTLNSEKTLKRAIRSILDQTLQDFEVIIIDDSSVDKTKEIAMSFGDERISFIKNEKHLGLGLSRNVGVKNSKGKYIVLLDSDDKCFPKRLEDQYNFLEKKSDYDVCGSRAVRIINGKKIDQTVWHPLEEKLIGPTLLFTAFCLPSSMMIRKTLFTEKNLWFSDIKTLEDHEYQARLYSNNIKMANINDPVVEYYMHSGTKSNKIEVILQEKPDRINIISSLLKRINFNFTEKEIENFMMCNHGKFYQKVERDSVLQALLFFKKLYKLCLESGLYEKKELEFVLNKKFLENVNYYKDFDESRKLFRLSRKFTKNLTWHRSLYTLAFIKTCSIKSKLRSNARLVLAQYGKYNPEKGKTKIYFLFQSKAFWPSWDTFYNSCLADEMIEVKLIFCPVKRAKSSNGNNGQFIDAEKWLKENKIPYIHIKDINFNKDTPDVLVIQTPYDDWHRDKGTSSKHYKNMGIRVVYISYGLYFVQNSKCIVRNYISGIHTNAWRIYTQNQEEVEVYGKYCPIGNSHVRGFGHPKFDALSNLEQYKMPEDLKKKVKGRKVIIWHVHFPAAFTTLDGQEVFSTFSWEKDLQILDYIHKNPDLFFVFMPHHMFFGIVEHQIKIPKEEVEAFKKNLETGENSTIWHDDYRPPIAWADACIGERSSVTFEIMAANTPMCYLEEYPEKYNKFATKLLSSCNYATDFKGVEDFLNDFKKGKDTKKAIRKKVLEEVLPKLDGKIGLRIKEDILESLRDEAEIPIKLISTKLYLETLLQ
jgi:glycosyltransferase involved in cell wall biosynthesis